jgi:hypothetical protein
MSWWSNVKNDVAADWKQNKIGQQQNTDVNSWKGIWKDAKEDIGFLTSAGSSIVMDTANALGNVIGSGASGGSGGGSYTNQQTVAFDKYSSYYTFQHDNTFQHPPANNQTLYAMNNIPVNTSNTNVYCGELK